MVCVACATEKLGKDKNQSNRQTQGGPSLGKPGFAYFVGDIQRPFGMCLFMRNSKNNLGSLKSWEAFHEVEMNRILSNLASWARPCPIAPRATCEPGRRSDHRF